MYVHAFIKKNIDNKKKKIKDCSAIINFALEKAIPEKIKTNVPQKAEDLEQKNNNILLNNMTLATPKNACRIIRPRNVPGKTAPENTIING